MRASSISFRVAVCLGIIGMSGGIAMAVTHNHALTPAHAHLNLLGWVSLFLFGLFYRHNPALDQSKTARFQVSAFAFGSVLLVAGVTGIYGGAPYLEPLAGIGSIIVVISMLLFAYLVFRPDRTAVSPTYAAPAE